MDASEGKFLAQGYFDIQSRRIRDQTTNLPISSTATANAEFVLCEWATIHRSSADVAFMIFFQIKLYINLFSYMSLFSKNTNTEQAQHHTGGNYVYAHTTSDYFLFVCCLWMMLNPVQCSCEIVSLVFKYVICTLLQIQIPDCLKARKIMLYL